MKNCEIINCMTLKYINFYIGVIKKLEGHTVIDI